MAGPNLGVFPVPAGQIPGVHVGRYDFRKASEVIINLEGNRYGLFLVSGVLDFTASGDFRPGFRFNYLTSNYNFGNSTTGAGTYAYGAAGTTYIQMGTSPAGSSGQMFFVAHMFLRQEILQEKTTPKGQVWVVGQAFFDQEASGYSASLFGGSLDPGREDIYRLKVYDTVSSGIMSGHIDVWGLPDVRS